MLFCCNCHFYGRYFRVLSNTKDFYRKIEFGICPKCGTNRFSDYRITLGKIKQKILSGKNALCAFENTLKKLSQIKTGTKSKQNFYYGDFKKTNKKDGHGNPVYLQLKRNFNNDTEILGEIKTKVFNIDDKDSLWKVISDTKRFFAGKL